MPEQTTAYVHKGGVAEVKAFGVSKTPVFQQEAIPDVDGAVTDADVNAILAVLRAFGFIASSS